MLLSASETEKILQKYKIPYPSQKLCKDVQDAVDFAWKIKFPIVLKLDSPEAVHKTEGGFIKVGINTEEELRNVFSKMTDSAKKNKMKINGFIAQQQVSGIECIIGMKEDPTFGKVVMFGLGGIYAEVMKDVVFRAVPLQRKDADEIIQEIRAKEIFTSRGRKSNLRAVAEILMSVSKLAEGEDIKEMDINPLFVSEKVYAADVKLIR